MFLTWQAYFSNNNTKEDSFIGPQESVVGYSKAPEH